MSYEEFDRLSFEHAESLFWFVGQDDEYRLFCEKCQSEDLSIAEYVFKYRLRSFLEFLDMKLADSSQSIAR